MILYILILISWAAYLFKVPFLYDCLHLAADLFTAGKSDIKVLFLLSAVTIVVLLNMFLKRAKGAHVAGKYAHAFFIGCAGLFLFGIAAFIGYYRDLSAGINTMLVALSTNDLSTTYFLHSHVMKSTFGLVFSVLPSFLQRNADLGVAYGGILPSYVAWVGLAGFIVLFPLMCLLIVRFIKNNRSNLALQILFTIAIVALFKNLFDGGFFNYETIPSFIILWILIYGSNFTRRVAIVPLILQILPVGYLLVSYGYGTLDSHGAAEYLRIFMCQELVYLGWYLLAAKKSAKTFGILVLVLGLIGGIATVLTRADYVQYGYQDLNGKTAYLGTYNSLPASVGELQEKIGDISIYKIQLKKDVSVESIAKMSDDNLTYFPISIEWNTCIPTGGEIDNPFIIASKENLKIPDVAHTFMNITDIKSDRPSVNGWNYYKVTFTGLSCVPRPLDVIQELLKEAGGVHMVMMLPLTSDQDDNDLSNND